MTETAPLDLVKRTCRFCGKTFRVPKGQSKRRGCPEFEPPLLHVPRDLSA